MESTASPLAASEQSIAALVECVYRHPRHRELYYQALLHCMDERGVEEVEEFIESLPAFGSALQTSSTLIDVLLSAGGLVYTEYDADGKIIDDERVEAVRRAVIARLPEGTSADDAVEDALYELVDNRTLSTSETGAAVVELLDPVKRVTSYASSRPDRTPAYRKLLEFCLTPRTLEEIKGLLDEDPVLKSAERSGCQGLKASYFIDRMNESGGLQWNGRWLTTDAGQAYLKTAS